MRDVINYLSERELEFNRHLSLARSLERRVDQITEGGDIDVEVRHINTLKSGLLIHLYNIVEAIATRTMEVVGRTVVTEHPKNWTEPVMKEWVRATIWSGEDRVGEAAVTRFTRASAVLASGGIPEAFVVKSEPGSWNDKAIEKVARRLGCQLALTDDVKRAACEPRYRDESSAMAYLAQRRNAIAHGATTFEDGAYDLTLDELSELARRVLPFLREVTTSYETFLADKGYLAARETAA